MNAVVYSSCLTHSCVATRSMLGFTVFIGVVVAARGFVIGKGVGAALLVLYTVFFIVLVILQTHT